MVRVIIASTQSELLRNLRNYLATQNGIESAVAVTRVIESDSKAHITHGNVIIIDIDSIPDLSRLAVIKSRHRALIICVSATGAFANAALRAGSDEFVLKPAIASPISSQKFFDVIYDKIRLFIRRQKPPVMRELIKMVGKNDKRKILAIASSTGGTNALEDLLKQMPEDIPPTVAVQHMSSGFTKLFAERLNANLKQTVKEAVNGDYLMRGTVLLAPCDRHMRLVHREGRLAVECFVGDKIHGVMPAADILFESVAEIMKSEAIGVVLTGMGADGARGLKLMRNAGAKTIGQNEATCVVYGMPKVAKDLGAVMYELPLENIGSKIMSFV